MCIICFKPAGKTLLKSTIETMFWNNDDGAGYMFRRDGKVHGRKGFRTDWVLTKSLTDEGLLGDDDKIVEDAELMLHCRIATHGGITPAMCHPFPLEEDDDLLRKLEWECHGGMMHNGTIAGLNTTWNASDTMLFCRDFMSDKELQAIMTNGAFASIFGAFLKSNKLAFMFHDKNVFFGDWVKGLDGCYYSNRSFTHKQTKRYYGGWWDWKTQSWRYDNPVTANQATNQRQCGYQGGAGVNTHRTTFGVSICTPAGQTPVSATRKLLTASCPYPAYNSCLACKHFNQRTTDVGSMVETCSWQAPVRGV